MSLSQHAIFREIARSLVKPGECQCGCGKLAPTAVHDNPFYGHVKGQSQRFIHGHNRRMHCMYGTPEYTAYQHAKLRCTLQHHHAWSRYGGRGIKFLFTNFDQFYAELGPRPEGRLPSGKPLYSLDRINNDGHYQPGNVRWATKAEQRANQCCIK